MRLPKLEKEYTHFKLNTAFVNRNRSDQTPCATFGCGAGTNSIVINNDLTVSACDLLTEEDRSIDRIRVPSDIDRLWRTDPVFQKWRRNGAGKTTTISDFSEVHAHGCHVAYATYGRNILAKV